MVTQSELAKQLQNETVVVRLQRHWFNASRKCTASQNEKAAKTFGAKGKRFRGQKELVDSTDPEYRAVASIVRAMESYWNWMTVPFGAPGKRLLRVALAEEYKKQDELLSAKLIEAQAALRAKEDQLKAKAEEEMGELYREEDFEGGIADKFGWETTYTQESPPDHLKKLHPDLYAKAEAQIQAMYEAALNEQVQELATQLAETVDALVKQLGPKPDGKKMQLKECHLDNLETFFGRFKALNFGASADLDQIVQKAQDAVQGVTTKDIKGSGELKDSLHETMSELRQKLDGMIVEAPKRKMRVKD